MSRNSRLGKVDRQVLFLLLNVIFGSAFMLFIKWAQIRETDDVITVGVINYIVAAVLIAPFFFAADSSTYTRPAMITGATMGLSYFIAYFFAIFAIKWIGVSSASVIAVLSILVPISFGVFIWGEQPSGFQIAGMLLALGSLLLIGGHKKQSGEKIDKPWFSPIMLIVFFVLCGSSRLSQEAFENWCGPDEKMTFNFAAFSMAAIPSIIVLIYRRKRIRRSEWAIGFGMGLSNFLQTQFILESLERFESFIVFPIVSAGGIILTTLVATRLLNEKLTRNTYIGISIATVALVLLNWAG